MYTNHKPNIIASPHSHLNSELNNKMGGENWSVIGRLKKAVKKINSLLRLNRTKWCLSCFLKSFSGRRRLSLSFNDRLGLQGCIEDKESNERGSVRALQRVTSYAADDDVDKRAELFISNFRRQLWLERQVSLELRYSGTLDKDSRSVASSGLSDTIL